jgi:hypothetical protein
MRPTIISAPRRLIVCLRLVAANMPVDSLADSPSAFSGERSSSLLQSWRNRSRPVGGIGRLDANHDPPGAE